MRVPSPSRPAPTRAGPSRSSPGPRRSAGSSSGRRPGFLWRWATSCGSTPAATSACSRTAGTGSGSRAACCSTRATSGTFGVSPTCPGARSRPCRRVRADAPGIRCHDRPLRADRRRRLCLRSDRRGGRRRARQRPVRLLRRARHRGASPWRPRCHLLDLWRGDPSRVRGPEGRGHHHLGDRHRGGEEDPHRGRRHLWLGRPGRHRVPLLWQLRRRLRRGPGGGRAAPVGRLEADLRSARSGRGHARGLERLLQPVHRPVEVQVQDPPRHRGPGAGRPDRPQGAGGDGRSQRRPCPSGPGLHHLRPPAACGVEQPDPADHRRDRLVGRAAGHRAQCHLPAPRRRHQLPAARHGCRLCPWVHLPRGQWRHAPHPHLRHAGGPARHRGPDGRGDRPGAGGLQGQHLQHRPDDRPKVLRQQLPAARDRDRAERPEDRPHVGLHGARLAARFSAGHEPVRRLPHPGGGSAGVRARGERPHEALGRAGHLGAAQGLCGRGRPDRDLRGLVRRQPLDHGQPDRDHADPACRGEHRAGDQPAAGVRLCRPDRGEGHQHHAGRGRLRQEHHVGERARL